MIRPLTSRQPPPRHIRPQYSCCVLPIFSSTLAKGSQKKKIMRSKEACPNRCSKSGAYGARRADSRNEELQKMQKIREV